MKLFALTGLLALSAFGGVDADGHGIVAAARSQINVPYSFAGGSFGGKSTGVGQGAHIVGFDCSGLAQYAVYQGTHKKIGRTATAQFQDKQCHHLPYGQHQPGDLVFFQAGGHITHVTIAATANTVVHAPKPGDHVREAPIWSAGRVAQVTRCW